MGARAGERRTAKRLREREDVGEFGDRGHRLQCRSQNYGLRVAAVEGLAVGVATVSSCSTDVKKSGLRKLRSGCAALVAPRHTIPFCVRAMK